LYKYNTENELEHGLKDFEPMIEKIGLIESTRNDVSNKELMCNVMCNLNEYLSYIHGPKMINEHNNPIFLVCMFPTLFPYGLGLLESHVAM
jgi:hypothetical protein